MDIFTLKQKLLIVQALGVCMFLFIGYVKITNSHPFFASVKSILSFHVFVPSVQTRSLKRKKGQAFQFYPSLAIAVSVGKSAQKHDVAL